jgi:hypothetical protein
MMVVLDIFNNTNIKVLSTKTCQEFLLRKKHREKTKKSPGD